MSAPWVTTDDPTSSGHAVHGSHKQAALEFLRLSAAGRPREAFDAYVGPNFRHHNPHFPSDAESLIVGMEKNAAENPGKVLEVLRAIEDGDVVAVHARIRLQPDDPGWSVIHVFRFEAAEIVELWDVGQEVMKDSPNEAGMF
ncbi:MAG: nuclear transport factor 2 family protein [Acidimicrobiia bacterium]